MKKEAIFIMAGCLAVGVGVGVGINLKKDKPVSSESTVSEGTSEVAIPAKSETINNSGNGLEAYGDHKINATELEKQYNKDQEEFKSQREEDIVNQKQAYAEDPDSYLIEESGTEKLISDRYIFMRKELCDLARNEIYARHGYIFTKDELKKVFEAKKWYKPSVSDIDQIQLSDVERFNVQCLEWWAEKGDYPQYATPDKGFTDCYQFKADESFKIDLNGDGQLEEIVYKQKQEDGDEGSAWLEINGQKSEAISGFFDPNIWVVDIDPADPYLEVIIYDQGPSGDPVDYYYTYDGSSILDMGAVAGHLNTDDHIQDKVLHAVKRSDILGTNYYSCNYKLDQAHKLEEIPCEWVDVEVPILAAEETKIYSDKDLSSSTTVCKVGTPLTAIQTDLENWVKVKLEDGSEGWVSAEDMYNFAGLFYCD